MSAPKTLDLGVLNFDSCGHYSVVNTPEVTWLGGGWGGLFNNVPWSGNEAVSISFHNGGAENGDSAVPDTCQPGSATPPQRGLHFFNFSFFFFHFLKPSNFVLSCSLLVDLPPPLPLPYYRD